MAEQSKKGGKGAPKLKRASRDKTKYASQFQRTFKNKLRRVRKHNGEAAAQRYALDHSPHKVSPFDSIKKETPASVKAKKHSVTR